MPPILCSSKNSLWAGKLLLSWLALLLLVATPLRAQSSGQTLTLAEYRDELQAAITALEAAQEDEAAESEAAESEEETIAAWQKRFAGISQVKYPNDDVVNVTSILAGLDSTLDDEQALHGPSMLTSATDVALARLHGAMEQIDASAGDNTAARLAILSEILARPEFNAPMSWWDRFWQWLRNLIADILPESQASASGGWLGFLIRAVPWLVTIIVAVAVLWLLSYWLQRLLQSFVSDARIAELAGDNDMPASAAEARQQARDAAQSGLYRDAVRRLYLAALLQLSEHDLISYERSLTNREVLIRVPAASPIRPHLEPVIATFDQVWYGVREPDQATFNAYEQEIDALAAVAERTAASSSRQGNA